MGTCVRKVVPLRQRRLLGGPIPFFAPPVVVLVLLFVVPVVFAVFVSFLAPSRSGLWSNQVVLDNYVRVFTNRYYTRALLQTVLLALSIMAVDLVLGYLIAYFLAFSKSRLTILIPPLLVAPLFVAGIVRAYGWMIVLSAEGPLNKLLLWLGVTDHSVRFLWNRQAVAIGMSEYFLPFMIFPIFSVLVGIDRSLLEAAESVGAGPIRRFLRITLPLSIGGVVSGCIIVFCGAFASFIYPQLLGGGRVKVLGTLVYQYFLQTVNWPLGAAIGTVALAVSVVLISVYLRFGKRYTRL